MEDITAKIYQEFTLAQNKCYEKEVILQNQIQRLTKHIKATEQQNWNLEKGMDYWSAQTDFTKLQTLEFDAYLTSDRLRHLATKVQLPCLKTLVLSNLRKERENSDDAAEAANELLRSLPPLMSLTLDGWYPEISIHALATHHGPRLLELNCSITLAKT